MIVFYHLAGGGVVLPLCASVSGGKMNLIITGHHLEVTPALRQHVITKLKPVLRHLDQVSTITVQLAVEKKREKERRQRAEVSLRVYGKDIEIRSEKEDLYDAIDELMDKLDRKVLKERDRIRDLQPSEIRKERERASQLGDLA